MVRILYFGIIRQYTNCKEETIEAKTLDDMVEHLAQTYGKATVKTACASMIVMNGEKVETLNHNLIITDNSIIGIHPLCCGG